MTAPSGPLDASELELIDAWWRAANYLAVGQIYLLDNPLLREPLRPEHVKGRLFGHWGTTPGSRHRTRRLVSCHLGSGVSVAAILDGLGVNTTMGFTPLDGLVMATWAGSVDPGLLTYLLREGISFGELDDGLERRSGLLGLCGTGDMASVVAKAGSGEPAARLALDVYVHRLVASIAGMAAALGGLDVLSFTGGVGEHSAEVRAEVAGRLEWLGVAIDQGANRGAPGGDADLSAAGAPVRTLVLTAHEDLEIARLVEDCVGGRVAVRR